MEKKIDGWIEVLLSLLVSFLSVNFFFKINYFVDVLYLHCILTSTVLITNIG